MGVTYTRESHGWTGGGQREIVLEATFDDAYTTGGEPLEPSDAGLGSIENVTIETNVTDSGLVVSYDHANGTLELFDNETGAEATAADANGDTVRVTVRGRS